MTHRIDTPPSGFRFAEAVLPGHPDKLADQIADAIVDIALAKDNRAIVQVEVAVHQNICHINGRVSTAGGALDPKYVEATVRGVYERACFGVPFEGVGDGTDYACPRAADVTVQLACTIDEADPDEHAIREYTDDQAIHIGYAIGTPETRWLPMEQHLALLLRDRFVGAYGGRPHVGRRARWHTADCTAARGCWCGRFCALRAGVGGEQRAASGDCADRGARAFGA